MAWVHPDDESFSRRDLLSDTTIRELFTARLGLGVTSISSPEDHGVFHKLYFVSLSEAEGHSWSGRDVVLRVARKTFDRVKTENEMATLELLRDSGVPVPKVVFFSADPHNSLGYEYNCLEKIPYPSLAKIWQNLSPSQLDTVLDQLVDIFVKVFDVGRPGRYGGLALGGGAGPVVEEAMWQIPDIARYFHSSPYNLTTETFASLNPTGFYETWPDYVSAFLKSYHHIVSIHPAVSFLRDFLPRLQLLIDTLDKPQSTAEPWVQRLRTSEELRPRLYHTDFHFGNILADVNGTIKGIIDWEFARMGPPFSVRMSWIGNIVSDVRATWPDNPVAQNIGSTWSGEFHKRLAERAPQIAAIKERESDRDAVLGTKGNALQWIWVCLRSALEYGVRSDESVEGSKGSWVKVLERELQTLGL
ncbi:APH domain-containing protein [Mycena indigotica]|uniref:APH domain-containing protein n=1 Tax=Mycena indigotica TaxID=2126181 RepID=A0A8H6SF13_9AGAR|nr:APH domain-containing protein [Mycena indigotica]KAF7297162.1 APH domain-containing protein [Mycena indigotica]